MAALHGAIPSKSAPIAGVRLVARRQQRNRQRPVDRQARVARMQAAFARGGVRDRVAIEHVDVVGKRLQAVREALRNQQGDAVVAAQPLAVPVQEGRRAAAQVDRDIEDLAAQAVNELFLGMRRTLEMQAADAAALCRPGVVDLRHRRLPAGIAQLVGAEDARQKAARVAEARAAHALQAGERGVLDDEAVHGARPESVPRSAPAPAAS